MKSQRCLFSASRALRSVFLPTPQSIATRSAPVYLLTPRLFSTTTPDLYIRSKPKPGGAGGSGAKISRLPTDNAIPYKWVRINDCHNHGLAPENPNSDLSAPVRAADILKGMDRAKYTLVMVSLPSRPKKKDEDEDNNAQPETLESIAERQRQNSPVCKIIDKQAHARAVDDKAREARKKEQNRKELELNWAIAPNDLQHRLRQLRDFLAKGKRVELMLAKKRGGRTATRDEGEALLAKLRETADEVGAKQVKTDGKFPGVVNLVYEGKTPPKAPAS